MEDRRYEKSKYPDLILPDRNIVDSLCEMIIGVLAVGSVVLLIIYFAKICS